MVGCARGSSCLGVIFSLVSSLAACAAPGHERLGGEESLPAEVGAVDEIEAAGEEMAALAEDGDACCEAHADAGCVDAEVAACVCARDSFCCQGEWDELCVAGVEAFGCGGCGDPGDGSCCLAHGGPGCDDAAVAACVCEAEPSCCSDMWDDGCVEAVEAAGCGPCG